MIRRDHSAKSWPAPATGAIITPQMPSNTFVRPSATSSAKEARLGDPAIRSALVGRLSATLRDDEVLVHELGLLQGSSRIDLAVVNGCVHGYEIKSDIDTLARLAGQRDAYSRALHYVTIVVTAKHASAAKKMVPRWWGVDVADAGETVVSITNQRQARPNPRVDRFSLAQLLWRDEVIAILRDIGAKPAILRGPRRAMWQAVAEAMSTEQLTKLVCTQIRRRGDWRSDQEGAPRRAGATTVLPELQAAASCSTTTAR